SFFAADARSAAGVVGARTSVRGREATLIFDALVAQAAVPAHRSANDIRGAAREAVAARAAHVRALAARRRARLGVVRGIRALAGAAGEVAALAVEAVAVLGAADAVGAEPVVARVRAGRVRAVVVPGARLAHAALREAEEVVAEVARHAVRIL